MTPTHIAAAPAPVRQTLEPTVGTAEIAEMLGFTRPYVTDRITKRPDFPKPAINISRRTKYWRRSEVLAWMRGDYKRAATSSAVSR